MAVELHRPIANDLEPHPADLRRLDPGSRLRKSPPAPEAAWPEAHPSTASRRPSPSAHQNQPEVEWPWRTSCARHLESDTRRFGNPPSESRLLSFGISPRRRDRNAWSKWR